MTFFKIILVVILVIIAPKIWKLLRFIGWVVKDKVKYYLNHEWLNFDGFGLHVYVGMFGSGKTTAMVEQAYYLALKYPDMEILTNMKLMNFPERTKIIKLENYKQIIHCKKDTLIILDELSSEANSRMWKDDGIPPDLLRHILQVRKQHKMMLTTAQRFMHVDALYRQITFSVRECETRMKRWTFVTIFDGWDYENKPSPNVQLEPLKKYNFIMTDKIRALFDTDELVEKLKKTEYIPNNEILLNQGSKTFINVGEKEENKKGILQGLISKIAKK